MCIQSFAFNLIPFDLAENRLGSHSDRNRAQLYLRCLCNPPWNRYDGIYLKCTKFSFGGSRKDSGNGLFSIVLTSTHLFFTKILTGAQIPLSQLRNDAVDNLMGALTIAGHYIIPGTYQVFVIVESLAPIY